jgi:thiol-disulfide isomerase/thioredoxin
MKNWPKLKLLIALRNKALTVRRSTALIAVIFIAVAGAVMWAVKPQMMASSLNLAVPSELVITTLADKRVMVGAADRPLLISFWATTCAICLKEMPRLAQFQKDYAHLGLRTIAVAMPYDRPLSVLDYAKGRQFDLDYAIDLDGKINQALGGVRETPTALVIYKGKVVKVFKGEPVWGELETLIKSFG